MNKLSIVEEFRPRLDIKEQKSWETRVQLKVVKREVAFTCRFIGAHLITLGFKLKCPLVQWGSTVYLQV